MEIPGSEQLHHLRQLATGLWLKGRSKLEAHENCGLLSHYAASSGNFLTTFWDNLSVPSSGVKNPKKLQLLAA